MNIAEIREEFNNKEFSNARIKKSEAYNLEGFLSKDLPFFWDAIERDNRSFYLFGKRYYDNNMFAVVLFKTKNHYNIAYSDDIHKTNVDLESVPFDKMDAKLKEIFDLERRCSISNDKKRDEVFKLLQAFIDSTK